MSRIYNKLSCGCMVSCDNGGGLLGSCKRDNCQFIIWTKKHKICGACNECLICNNNKCHGNKEAMDIFQIFGFKP